MNDTSIHQSTTRVPIKAGQVCDYCNDMASYRSDRRGGGFGNRLIFTCQGHSAATLMHDTAK